MNFGGKLTWYLTLYFHILMFTSPKFFLWDIQ
jgi:hypothetical protein